MKDSILETLQTKVDDAMESVEAIQGVGFRNLLAHVMACSQVMRLAAMTVKKYDDDEMIEHFARQVAAVMAKSSSMLAEAYELSDAQCEELMKWVETLDSHVLDAIKEANK